MGLNGLRRSSNALFGLLCLFDSLKLFAGLEADGFAGGNVDLFAGAGIAADACLARLQDKDAEAAEYTAQSAAKSLRTPIEDGFLGLPGVGAAGGRPRD